MARSNGKRLPEGSLFCELGTTGHRQELNRSDPNRGVHTVLLQIAAHTGTWPALPAGVIAIGSVIQRLRCGLGRAIAVFAQRATGNSVRPA